MEQQLKRILKTLKINEGLISSVMGAVVVVVMAAMIFNYFKSVNKNGNITDESASKVSEETNTPKELPATYKVKKGDDLWHISESFYGSGYNYVDIIKENKLPTSGVVFEGNELKIPKVEPKILAKAKVETKAIPAEVKEVTKTEVKTEVKSKVISIEGEKYTTVKGDHLWSIAVRAYGDGYAWVKIYNANKKLIGKNPSVLFSQVELTLPR